MLRTVAHLGKQLLWSLRHTSLLEIRFRYENPIAILEGGCKAMSKLPLAGEENQR